MNTLQKRAANSYKTAGHQGMGDREIMAEAFRVLMQHLTTARDAYTNRSFDAMLTYNLKTIKILDVLYEELVASNAMEDPEAVPPAKFLLHTYRDLIIRLTDILKHTSPVDEFNAMIESLKPIYRAWLPPAPQTLLSPSNDSQPLA